MHVESIDTSCNPCICSHREFIVNVQIANLMLERTNIDFDKEKKP
jgi:hypothetical protein